MYAITELDNGNILKARNMSDTTDKQYFCFVKNGIAPIEERSPNTAFTNLPDLSESLKEYIKTKTEYNLVCPQTNWDITDFVTEYSRFCPECQTNHVVRFETERPCL